MTDKLTPEEIDRLIPREERLAMQWTHLDNDPDGSCVSVEYAAGLLEEIERERASASLHASINRAVATALDLEVGKSWHNLGVRVSEMKAENARLREIIAHLERGNA